MSVKITISVMFFLNIVVIVTFLKLEISVRSGRVEMFGVVYCGMLCRSFRYCIRSKHRTLAMFSRENKYVNKIESTL